MKTMDWVDRQIIGGLPREVINGVECYVLGDKVLPVKATAEAISRTDVELLVTVRDGHYHQPGCRHWDTGDQLVPILQALNDGALPCTAMARVGGRWQGEARRAA